MSHNDDLKLRPSGSLLAELEHLAKDGFNDTNPIGHSDGYVTLVRRKIQIREELLRRFSLDFTRMKELEEALVWCSGASDFQERGFAREGWEKMCAPLLRGIREQLVRGNHEESSWAKGTIEPMLCELCIDPLDKPFIDESGTARWRGCPNRATKQVLQTTGKREWVLNVCEEHFKNETS